MTRTSTWCWVLTCWVLSATVAGAQTVTQRGFVEGAGVAYPQTAPNDQRRLVGDLLLREELFYKPVPWVQFAAGLDARASSHDLVEDRWRLDFSDHDRRRPRLSVRRLTATLTRGPFTVDIGKQFIRWGKTDIVNPTDHFAPRDFLNVVNSEFLAVRGIRGVAQRGADTLEIVWTPGMTPSRTPLLEDRWTAVPPSASGVQFVDRGTLVPDGSQTGLRWGHVGDTFEYSASFFDGFNHLPGVDANVQLFPPAIEIRRTFPEMRSYGGDFAMPTHWFIVKGEAAYVTSSAASADDYVLYVLQLERQYREWVFVGGYAGEAVTRDRAATTFAPDRGLSKAFVGRASYTIDTNRSAAIEGAIRQNGRGAYAKGEYSHARGEHWRATVTVVGIGGEDDDFLGQYHRNSHAALTVRYSF